jgi:hypothetical protein
MRLKEVNMEEEWSLDDEGKFNCPYNEACHCDLPTCGCCGWNPEVARRRHLEWIKKRGAKKDDSKNCTL